MVRKPCPASEVPHRGRGSQDETMTAVAGYLHPAYAESLAEFGLPRHLPKCGGWILERKIPGTRYHDGMGCYPLFACEDWQQLGTDLRAIGSDLVSLAVVTDPFGAYDVSMLQRCFRDVVRPFKDHYVIDLRQPLMSYVSRHHARNARKSLQRVEVEVCESPMHSLKDWLDLYSQLTRKHKITGIPAFSSLAFNRQFQVPGIVVFRAAYGQETVGMLVWYQQGEVGYYHLGAYSITGYDLRVSFALFWRAIEHFSACQAMRWLDLGAGAGVTEDNTDGLSRFKRGWASGTQTAHLCGRILDPATYYEITEARKISPTSYFPAYRLGEFGDELQAEPTREYD